MTTQSALQFLQYVRQDERLKEVLNSLGQDVTVEDLVRLGKTENFNFTTDELYAAFEHDWSMRLLRYQKNN